MRTEVSREYHIMQVKASTALSHCPSAALPLPFTLPFTAIGSYHIMQMEDGYEKARNDVATLTSMDTAGVSTIKLSRPTHAIHPPGTGERTRSAERGHAACGSEWPRAGVLCALMAVETVATDLDR